MSYRLLFLDHYLVDLMRNRCCFCSRKTCLVLSVPSGNTTTRKHDFVLRLYWSAAQHCRLLCTVTTLCSIKNNSFSFWSQLRPCECIVLCLPGFKLGRIPPDFRSGTPYLRSTSSNRSCTSQLRSGTFLPGSTSLLGRIHCNVVSHGHFLSFAFVRAWRG